MFAFLAWGFLVGMQHALEPDHLAAVGSLASRHRAAGNLPRAGLFWGIGHAIPLLVIGALAIVAHATIPKSWATAAELAVGLMLVGLGGRVIYKLWRERVHVHVHAHGDGHVHLHAHSHRALGAHDHAAPHAHDHEHALPWRSTLVGLTHGMAGSAALVVMAGASSDSAWKAMAFVAVFSIGAMIGMAALGMAISIPMRFASRTLERSFGVVHFAVGAATVMIGARIVHETGGALFLGH